jgi:hypothetical protein
MLLAFSMAALLAGLWWIRAGAPAAVAPMLPTATDSTSLAQGRQYVLGDALYPYSAQPKPQRGQSYVDSTYHLTVTRLTSSQSDSGKWGTMTGYATWNPLSPDGKYLILLTIDGLQSAGGYVLYDADNFKFIRLLSFAHWWNSQDPEPRWDRTEHQNHRITYRKDKQLRYYDCDTRLDGLIHDFTDDFPVYGPGYFIFSHEYGSPSLDGRYFAFYLANENTPYDKPLAFVYDRIFDRVVSRKSLGSTGPQGVLMSPSGDYVVINYWYTGKGGEYDGPHAYTREFSRNIQVTKDIPHANFAWDSQGNEVLYYLDHDSISFTRLDTGQIFDLYPQASLGWTGSNLLFSYTSKRGWGFISTYSDSTSMWDYNQIFAIELDETKTNKTAKKPRIWRISFTQNIVGPDYYYQQPNAQIDYEATRIWWGANWRNIKDNPEVYQITLPSTWWEELSATK